MIYFETEIVLTSGCLSVFSFAIVYLTQGTLMLLIKFKGLYIYIFIITMENWANIYEPE